MKTMISSVYHSLIPSKVKKILSKMRRAVSDYHMIEDGDRICVGVSGGKDSMLLLKALSTYRRFSPEHFDVCAVCIDIGLGTDFAPLEEFCRELGTELYIKKTQIAEIVFDERHEKSPCSLCSNLKRGALHNAALEIGSRKIALGHHADDLMETFMLGLLYEGRIHTFRPVTHLDRKDITVIRPFLYLYEREIVYAANKNAIPIIRSGCPADGFTRREDMKNLIKQLRTDIPDSDARLFNAVKTYIDRECGEDDPE